MFDRPIYIEKIKSLMNNGRVKIITGIRRSGKSFLLEKLFYNYLKSIGVDDEHFYYISMEDLSNFELKNPLKLFEKVKSLIKDDKKYYIVIDEIQNVYNILDPNLNDGKIIVTKNKNDSIGFIQVVLGLMKISNLDLYITGSNSRFLSKDILTDFRDRGDEIHVLPFSFEEFYNAKKLDKEIAYEEYALYGGMPNIINYENNVDKEKYLENLYYLTYKKDVLERHDKNKHNELDILTKVIASNIGSLVNPNIIANTFNSNEKINITNQTINSYLTDLEDSYLLTKVNRFDVRGRKHIGATYKYYYSDIGLRNSRLNFMHSDKEHVMENIIYNELIYRGYNVMVGVIEAFGKDKNNKTTRNIYETDFVARIGNKTYYIQSSYDLYSDEKYEQESKSLRLIKDSFKKIIVTRQTGPIKRDINGIVTIGIIDFLLNKNSLDI